MRCHRGDGGLKDWVLSLALPATNNWWSGLCVDLQRERRVFAGCIVWFFFSGFR